MNVNGYVPQTKETIICLSFTSTLAQSENANPFVQHGKSALFLSVVLITPSPIPPGIINNQNEYNLTSSIIEQQL